MLADSKTAAFVATQSAPAANIPATESDASARRKTVVPLPWPLGAVQELVQRLKPVDRLVRLHFLQFSWMLILLGAASGLQPGHALGLGQLAGLLAIASSFHVFAYVLNDVVDLPVDRTQPSRRHDPLVSGAVKPGHALTLALAQVPIGVGLVALVDLMIGGTAAIEATVALLAGFVFMAIYDVWGKKCPVPPVTDLAQGLGWASLVACGAYLVGTPSSTTWVAFLYGAGFILLINGVHGGLRDLENDLANGCRTSAIFFGGRPGHEVTWGLRLFAGSVQAGLIALTLIALVRNDFGYSSTVLKLTSSLVIALNLVCAWNLLAVFQPERPSWGLAFRVHLFLLLVTWIVLFLPSLAPLTAAALVLGFLGPLLFFDATHQVLERLFSKPS